VGPAESGASDVYATPAGSLGPSGSLPLGAAPAVTAGNGAAAAAAASDAAWPSAAGMPRWEEGRDSSSGGESSGGDPDRASASGSPGADSGWGGAMAAPLPANVMRERVSRLRRSSSGAPNRTAPGGARPRAPASRPSSRARRLWKQASSLTLRISLAAGRSPWWPALPSALCM
jgi:hypothetical protein